MAGVVNDSATVLERYKYTPYGEVTFLEPDFDPIAGNESAIGNEILYTGRTRDAETHLYNLRTRYYHPNMGRFTSRDWIEYGGGMNLYGYVGGMPTGFVDPFGLDKVIWVNGELVIVDDFVDDFGNPTVTPWIGPGMGSQYLDSLEDPFGLAVGGSPRPINVPMFPDPTGGPDNLLAPEPSTLQLAFDGATVAGVGLAARGAATAGRAALSMGKEAAKEVFEGLTGFFNPKDLFDSFRRKPCPDLPNGGGGKPPKKLYHQGDLSEGVDPGRSLSTSPDPDLGHYHPGGQLYEFDVPGDVYDDWLNSGIARPGIDYHLPSGQTRPEIRIYPPGSGEMNDYLRYRGN